METRDLIDAMLSDLKRALDAVHSGEVAALQAALLSAERVFVAGKGRTGLQMRAFAMRLMHLGLRVHVVDDVTTPAIGTGDLLLIGSSSGRTGSLLRYIDTVEQTDAALALITGNRESPLVAAASTAVFIPATNFKAGRGRGDDSVFVMGALFEQCLSLLCDLMVIRLKAALSVTQAEMDARHANLE